MTNAICDIAEDPLELIGCLADMSTLLLGLAKNGLYINSCFMKNISVM